MYAYLGSGAAVREDAIIGVFDLDNASASPITREYLKKREDSGELISLAEGLPRYFIVTTDRRREKVYMTHIKMRSIV